MKRIFSLALSAASLFVPLQFVGAAERLELSDANCQVTFTVDSTWHLIQGKTSGLSGFVEYDPLTKAIHGSLTFPVAKFATENSARDERMREVMDASRFPDVIVDYMGFAGECLFPLEDSPCEGKLLSEVRIRGGNYRLKYQFAIVRKSDGHYVSGSQTLQWRVFGVEDPSILVAKLHEDVAVEFVVKLPLHK